MRIPSEITFIKAAGNIQKTLGAGCVKGSFYHEKRRFIPQLLYTDAFSIGEYHK